MRLDQIRFGSRDISTFPLVVTFRFILLDMQCTLDGGNGRINQSVGAAVSSQLQGNSEVEPSEGMAFDSEDAARAYYDEYAGRMGFLTRVLSSRRSERDGSIISRGLGCRSIPDSHKSAKISNEIGEKRREGCTAMFVVKKEMPERWVVRKFVRDHNHPLVPGNRTAFVSYLVPTLVPHAILCHQLKL